MGGMTEGGSGTCLAEPIWRCMCCPEEDSQYSGAARKEADSNLTAAGQCGWRQTLQFNLHTHAFEAGFSLPTWEQRGSERHLPSDKANRLSGKGGDSWGDQRKNTSLIFLGKTQECISS